MKPVQELAANLTAPQMDALERLAAVNYFQHGAIWKSKRKPKINATTGDWLRSNQLVDVRPWSNPKHFGQMMVLNSRGRAVPCL